MTKIILAYCLENQIIADKIIHALSSNVDIDKVVFTDTHGIDELQKHAENDTSKVLLLVSDNFLKSDVCMNNALRVIQEIGNEKRLMPIVTEGVYLNDNGQTYTVPTSFERVSHVIQYMNHWQDAYLELRRLKPAHDDDEFSEKVRVVRTISSEIGELLRYLRAMEFFNFNQFEESNYIILYRALGLNVFNNKSRADSKEVEMENSFSNERSENSLRSNENGIGAFLSIHSESNNPVADNSDELENSHFTLDALIDDINKSELAKNAHSDNNPPSNFNHIIDEVVNEDSIMADKITESTDNMSNEEIQNIFNDDSKENADTDLENIFNQESSETPPQYSDALDLNKAENTQEMDVEIDEKETIPSTFESKPEDIEEEETIKNEVSRIFNEVENAANQDAGFEFDSTAKSDGNEEEMAELSEENKSTIVMESSSETPDSTTTKVENEKFVNTEENKSGLVEAKAALSKDPLDNELRYTYAAELVNHHRFQDTIEQLEILIENDRTHVEAYILLAYAAEQSGDYLLSLSCLEKVTLINPSYPGIFYKLGMLINEHFKSQKRKALHYFKEAVAHDPENADAHYQLGKIELEQSSDFNKIIEHFNNAITFNPQHAHAAFELAKAYYEIGDKENAALSYLKAYENNSQFKTKINDEIFRYEVPVPEPEKPDINDNGMTVLITGATSGIGRATAEIFAQQGYRLILTGRRADRLNEVKEHFESEFKNKNQILNFDVRSLDSVKKALDSIEEDWKNIDILINNAGLASGLTPIHEGDIEDWEMMIDTNIKGLLYMTRAIAPQMVARRKGHIINISSIAGKEIYPLGNVYSATKHAVDALTRATRVDLHKYNIRVSQVSPGAVEETEFSLVRFHGDAEKAKIYEDYQPIKASDVAESIFFIASRAEYVNIQDITLMGTQQAGANWFDRSGRKDRESQNEE